MLTSFESPEPNEAALIAEMTDILQRKMARDYAKGATRRDAHPKALGVLRGRFTVEPGLPAELRVGVFSQAQSYDCWVRVSNASGKPQADSVKDFRGFALKLMVPDGAKAEKPLGQDFVLMNFPTMPLGTVSLFRDAVYYSIEVSPVLLLAKLLIIGKLGVLKALNAGRSTPTSPLDIRYWSTTPYLFGEGRAVKYSLLPSSAHRSSMPTKLSDNYLSEAMQVHLNEHEASFDFCVQLRTGDMPIEDAGREWRETESPFIKVATLRFEPQQFKGNKERTELAEILSFSPAHALPEHAPLGGINRARIAIYKALSKFRHERDGRVDIA